MSEILKKLPQAAKHQFPAIRPDEPPRPVVHPLPSVSAVIMEQVLPAPTDDQLLEDAYQRGYAEGVASAEAESKKVLEQMLREERERMDMLTTNIREQLDHYCTQLEHDAYKFALAVAGRIIGREVPADDAIVIRQVQEAVRRVAGVDSVKLRVNPEDEDTIRNHRATAMEASDTLRELMIEGDDKIERGGCVIESAAGNVDARIATQLAQIESALFGKVPTP